MRLLLLLYIYSLLLSFLLLQLLLLLLFFFIIFFRIKFKHTATKQGQSCMLLFGLLTYPPRPKSWRSAALPGSGGHDGDMEAQTPPGSGGHSGDLKAPSPPGSGGHSGVGREAGAAAQRWTWFEGRFSDFSDPFMICTGTAPTGGGSVAV